MADTYRGLTIRIGGDATSLQKALRSVNSSISATEQQLRKMKKALEMDPDNMGAIETNLRLVGQRAVEAQRKVQELTRYIKQLESQKVDLFGGQKSVQTIRELADATEDANARAADAKRNYAAVTAEIAKLYQPIDKAAQKMESLNSAWKKLHNGKDFKTDDLVKESGLDEAIEYLRRYNLLTDESEAKMRRLNSEFHEAFDENQIAQSVQELEKWRVELTKSGAEAKSLAGRFSELSRASHGIDFGEGLDDQLRRIDAAAESVNDEMRRLDSALKLDGGNVDTIALKIRDMQEASALAERRVDLLRQKLDRMDASGVGKLSDETHDAALAAQKAAEEYDEATEAVTKLRGELSELESRQSLLDAKDAAGTDEYRELGDQIRSARTQLDRLVETQRGAKAVVDTSAQVTEYRQLQAEISEARAQQSKLNDEMQQMGRFTGITQGSLVSLGMSLSTTVTPAMVALGHGMIDSANDIDSAYRDMRKTVNGTEQDFESLRQAAIDFSATHVTSADQILSIQAIGGELGVATDDLKTFSETVSNLDVATDLNAEEAATALGQLSNIISDLTGDKFPNFADALVRLGNNGASTESAIADVASRIGAMGSIVGMTTPEILAWASTIASTGQGSEAAGTAISRTMSDIETAVANGGDALDAFAEIAGMSADEFAKAWTETPSAAMQSFIEGLVSVEEDGGSAITTLDNLGITAVRQVQSIQGLMQMIEGLDDNLEMSRDAWNGVSDEWGEAGDAAREADRKAEGFSGSLSRLQNMAQNVGAELGDSLVPIIDGVTDVLGDLYDTFVGLDDGTKQAIVAVGALAAAMGPLLLLGKGVSEFFGGVASGVKKLRDIGSAVMKLEGLSGALDLAKTSASQLGQVLTGGLVVGGIALLVAGVASTISHLEEMKRQEELTKKATEGLADACKIAGGSATDAADDVETLSESLERRSEEIDEAIQDNADLADSFERINDEASGTVSRLDKAKGAISLYAGQADLTESQVADLRAAIDYLNDQCGTNFDVVRDADGSYQIYRDGVLETKDAIYDLIEAQKQEAIMQAQQQKLTDLYTSLSDKTDAYTEDLANQTKAQKDYNDAYGELSKMFSDKGQSFDDFLAHPEAYTGFLWQNSDVSGKVQDFYDFANALGEANDNLASSEKDLNDTRTNIENVEASMGDLLETSDGAVESFDELAKYLNGVGGQFGDDATGMSEFAEALESSGHSLDQWKSVSETDLMAVVSMWQSTGGDINGILTQLGIDITGNAQTVRDALMSFGGGEVAAALEGAGVNIDNFALAMSNAGITSETLNQIGSANFSALAANCGGSIDTLLWMIQNYNATNIGSKTADLQANPAPLIDAQNRIYTWNGTELKTQYGQTVVDSSSLQFANDEILTWNDEGIPEKNGVAMAQYDTLTLANGEILTWNGTDLVGPKEGQVVVDEVELTDCLGNVATWNDSSLEPISGTVYCTYDELTAAIDAINSISGKEFSSTVYVNTVQTTTKRTVVEAPTTSGAPRSSPASVSAFSRMASVPVPDSTTSVMMSATSSAVCLSMTRFSSSSHSACSPPLASKKCGVVATPSLATVAPARAIWMGGTDTAWPNAMVESVEPS